MIPCSEKFALMIASPDEGTRGWLALAAIEAECYGLVVTTPRSDLAVSLLVRQAFDWPGAAHFDVVVSDHALPGLTGIPLITQLQNEPTRRPFMARLVQPREDVAEAVLEDGFDLFAPMPETLAPLTTLFRTIAARCITWYETVGA